MYIYYFTVLFQEHYNSLCIDISLKSEYISANSTVSVFTLTMMSMLPFVYMNWRGIEKSFVPSVILVLLSSSKISPTALKLFELSLLAK